MNHLSQLTPEELQLLEEVKTRQIPLEDLKEKELSVSFQHELVEQEVSWIAFISNPELEVQLEVVKKNPPYCLKLSNPCEEVFVEAVKHKPSLLSQIPTSQRTEAVCRQALETTRQFTSYSKKNREGAKLSSVPKKLRTDEMIELAIQANGLNIKSIKNPNQQWQRMAFENNPYAIEFIDASLFSEQELLEFLSKEPGHLRYLAKEQQTTSLVKSLLKINGMALGCLNRRPTQKEMEIAFEQTPYAARFFVNPSKGLAFKTLKSYGGALEYYPEKWHTPYWKEVALKSIVMDQQEKIMPGIAECFEENETTLDFIKAMCGNLTRSSHQVELDLIQLQNLKLSTFVSPSPDTIIESLPKQFQAFGSELVWTRKFKRNEEVSRATLRQLEQYLKEHHGGLVHVDEYIQTPKLCQIAFEEDVNEIKHIASPYRSYRMFRYAIKQNSELKQLSPYHLSEVVPEIFD